MRSSGSWQLKTVGDYVLSDPSGNVVQLRTKKVEGLLATLAFAPNRQLTRSEIQQLLWPDKTLAKSQASLRQAVALLKKAIGAHSVSAGRKYIGLDAGFRMIVDALSGTNFVITSAFLEAHSGPWKSAIESKLFSRTSGVSLRADLGADDLTSAPFDSLLNLVRWYSTESPVQALRLLRDHRSLVLGISPNELGEPIDRLLTKIDPVEPLYGWGLFYKGWTAIGTDSLIKAHGYFAKAIHPQYSREDFVLQSESATYLGIIEICLNAIDRASETLALATNLASNSKDILQKSKAQNALGTLKLHDGAVPEALKDMIASEQMAESNPLALATQMSLRSLYLAIEGRVDESVKGFDFVGETAGQTGHYQINRTIEMTNGFRYLAEGENDNALLSFRRLSHNAESGNSTHFRIYGLEGEALALWKQKHPTEAKRKLSEALELRREIKMKFTLWDQKRLGELWQLATKSADAKHKRSGAA